MVDTNSKKLQKSLAYQVKSARLFELYIWTALQKELIIQNNG
jgi:hypothetical protein